MNAPYAFAQRTFRRPESPLRDAVPPPAIGLLRAAGWRAFDLVVASAILILTLPFLLLLALVLYLSDPGPLFFVHRRIGHRGRTFGCIKFRSMKVQGDRILQEHLAANPAARREWAECQKLRHDPRVTPLGAIVRKLSLDEFPQLINILRGEMSIVGPRPIVEAEVERYGRYFEYYCHVRPGLTGLWQISGRNDTSYRQRVRLDVDYVLNKSILLDTRLVLATIPAVLMARGSY